MYGRSMYENLISRVESVFAGDEAIRGRLLDRIGHTSVMEVKDRNSGEDAVREAGHRFSTICRYYRGMLERNYLCRNQVACSYYGTYDLYDVIYDYCGGRLAPIIVEALLAIGRPWEKSPIQDLLKFLLFDEKDSKDTELMKLTVFVEALEKAKSFGESKGSWESDPQSLSRYYEGYFSGVERMDFERTAALLAPVRKENCYLWYLQDVIYPIAMQAYENHAFEYEALKSTSWKEAWQRLRAEEVPCLRYDGVADISEVCGGNEEIIRMLVKEGMLHFQMGTLHLYHPLWVFGSTLYMPVLNDFTNVFRVAAELQQLQKLEISF